jgi:hypothetical protein
VAPDTAIPVNSKRQLKISRNAVRRVIARQCIILRRPMRPV